MYIGSSGKCPEGERLNNNFYLCTLPKRLNPITGQCVYINWAGQPGCAQT